MTNRPRHLLFILLLLYHAGITATTVYVTDQLQVGLHADKAVDSPIVKIIPTGTTLELIKTEEELSFVREPGGTGGWIDNSYLSQTGPENLLLQEAETRIKSLEEDLATAGQESATGLAAGGDDLEVENQMLASQLELERSRAGELQRQLADLKKRAGPSGTDRSLYDKINQLNTEKTRLENQLAAMLESAPGSAPSAEDNSGSFLNLSIFLIALMVTLILGGALGVYVMDYMNRRRHGGFRV